MTRRFYANAAPQQTLLSGITSGATSCQIAGSFAGWPTQFPFFGTLDLGLAAEEIVSVTGIAGTTATIVRGQGGLPAVSHTSGATFDFTVVAADLDEPNAHINLNAGVHGVAGSVVGTSDAQTLTNKTLTSPTISTPTVTGTATTAGINATGTVAVTGAISATAGLSAASSTLTGALTAATVAASGASTAGSYAANGNGTVTGVVVPKTYTDEAAATAALGNHPAAGTLVNLTTPTTGPAGIWFATGNNPINSSWIPVASLYAGTPIARLAQTVVQTLTTASPAVITFDTEPEDSGYGGGHSNVTNPSRYTVPFAGVYQAHGLVAYAANATGQRRASLLVNGVTVKESEHAASGAGTTSAGISALLRVSVGDYIELQAQQSSGGNLNTFANLSLFSYLDLLWVRI